MMMYLRLFFISLILLTLAGCRSGEKIAETTPPRPVFTDDPTQVQLITSDITLFWEMFDRESPLFTKLEVDAQYFNAGTTALSLFYNEKIKSSDAFSHLLNNRFDRRYYEKVRRNTTKIPEQRDQIIHALQGLKKVYPEAVFTDVTFVIGKLGTSGVLLPNGQIVIAAEMFSKEPGMDLSYLSPWHQLVLRTPNYLPVIVLHEMVHLQQNKFIAPDEKQTLLDRALREGSADFITHIVLDTLLNPQLLDYGNAHEQAIWNRFRRSMNKTDYSHWLYNGNAGIRNDEPADLGYFIGYKIAEHYYQNSENKKRAIRKIIEIQDGQTFLKRSRYAESFK